MTFAFNTRNYFLFILHILCGTFSVFYWANDQLGKQSFMPPNLLHRGYKEINMLIIV